ncbi:hypothetical protein [Peribacillus sp. SI8-4]|nr:hypothetical protein [Peribacillus sp. SI8-4]
MSKYVPVVESNGLNTYTATIKLQGNGDYVFLFRKIGKQPKTIDN